MTTTPATLRGAVELPTGTVRHRLDGDQLRAKPHTVSPITTAPEPTQPATSPPPSTGFEPRPVGRPLSWEHGTRTGYNNHGCRCQPCTVAQSAYEAARRERIRAITVHGTATSYSKGCRCSPCKAAKSDQNATRNRRKEA